MQLRHSLSNERRFLTGLQCNYIVKDMLGRQHEYGSIDSTLKKDIANYPTKILNTFLFLEFPLISLVWSGINDSSSLIFIQVRVFVLNPSNREGLQKGKNKNHTVYISQEFTVSCALLELFMTCHNSNLTFF
jgi:hypothetical protein